MQMLKDFSLPLVDLDSKFDANEILWCLNQWALTEPKRNSAFKFLPVMGKYVADCFENKAPNDVREKWRLRPGNTENETKVKVGDGSRGGPPLRKLRSEEQAELWGTCAVGTK